MTIFSFPNRFSYRAFMAFNSGMLILCATLMTRLQTDMITDEPNTARA
jgi:hypothetical protein